MCEHIKVYSSYRLISSSSHMILTYMIQMQQQLWGSLVQNVTNISTNQFLVHCLGQLGFVTFLEEGSEWELGRGGILYFEPDVLDRWFLCRHRTSSCESLSLTLHRSEWSNPCHYLPELQIQSVGRVGMADFVDLDSNNLKFGWKIGSRLVVPNVWMFQNFGSIARRHWLTSACCERDAQPHDGYTRRFHFVKVETDEITQTASSSKDITDYLRTHQIQNAYETSCKLCIKLRTSFYKLYFLSAIVGARSQ